MLFCFIFDMDKTKFYRKLACPDTGYPLVVKDSQLLNEKSNISYKINNDIFQLFPLKPIENEYHQDYLEHYRIDGDISDYFEQSDCLPTREATRRQREYISSKIIEPYGSILDIGSGDAWVAKEFCKKSGMVVSMDASNRNLVEALRRYPFENHFAVQGDVLQPPFHNESFDNIIASEVIEHVVSPNIFINKLFDLLRPGGRLIVSTPFNEQLHYEVCIHCNKPTPRNAHLHSFTSDKLLSLCESNDLASSKAFVFGNKAMLRLRGYVVLSFLPFGLWKIVDKLSNIILPYKSHLLAVYDKK